MFMKTPDAEYTMLGVAPEFGLLIRPDWKSFRFGATFRLVSGNPRTPIVGSVYDANSDFYSPVYGRVNSARDPLFHQASVRIQNIYNHRSQEGLQYSYDYSRSKPVQGLPILPSLGLRGEF